MLLSQLIISAKRYLIDNQYTDSTISHNYMRLWNRFFKDIGDQEYSQDLMTDYIINRFGRNLLVCPISEMNSNEYRCTHAYLALNSFHNFGFLQGSSMSKSAVRQALDLNSNKVLNLYIKYLSEIEYSNSSKRYAYSTVHALLLSIPIVEMNDTSIMKYFQSLGNKTKTTIKSELRVIKHFFNFLWRKNIIAIDFRNLIPSSKKHSNTEIPSVYSTKEIVTLLNYLRSHGKNPLRNFTISLLIAVYGYRAGDVANLKLTDIHLDDAGLNIIQSKTTIRLNHKITNFCGRALAEYLFNERPEVESEYIFLKANGKKLSPTSISTMIFYGFTQSDIKINDRKHGSHCLRHSLAFSLMLHGENIIEIANVLGHSSIETTQKYYVKVDINHLRMCELEVPEYE
jgi:site-specific recombinase XerD